MASPEQALQRAMVAALLADAALVALIGSAGLYDRLIDRAALPYLVVADVTSLDWSTATEPGLEIVMTLEAWSAAAGKREVQAIAERVRAVLHDASLVLEAGTLVNLRLERTRIERVPKVALQRATMRLRAVIETD